MTVLLVLAAAGVAYAARVIRTHDEAAPATERAAQVVRKPTKTKPVATKLAPPKTMRGVHVTMALASIPG